MKKKIFTFFTAVFLLFVIGLIPVSAASSLTNPSPAKSGEFIRNGRQWSYRYKDGTLAKKCFLKINGQTYYFNSTGYRWFGWHSIKNRKYYFGTKSQGYLRRNTWLLDDGHYYYLDKNGSPRTGWVNTASGRRYYFDKNGQAAVGNRTIDGVSCSFSVKGLLVRTGTDLNISSKCALLMDADTGKILYAKNEHLPHANASTTKILTAILSMENAKTTDKVRASAYAASQEPTKLYMQEGQIFYMKDLWYSLLVASHNDSAVAIAEHVSGSESSFVTLMNKKAKKLGCLNTKFATASGLDMGLTHYTTANDLGKMAQYALKIPLFKKIIATSSYTMQSLNDKKTFSFKTSNELMGKIPGVIGMKTGFTSKAGNCFVGVVESKKGNTYISVSLGAPTSDARWKDARTLLEYGYER